jgi:hypothetical protein
MSEQLKKIVYDLLQFRRSLPENTERFAELKHNDDLCPRFREKIETIFFAFDKYQKITYDVQGPRDQGTDVVVRQRTGDEDYFICCQIKSEDDLKDASYLKILKAQLFDTQKAYQNILDYYIILCCNLIDRNAVKGLLNIDKKKREKIRSIEAEFAQIRGVHIIEPEFAISFLKLSTIQIDAAIKSKLGSEDIVFREALEIVNELTLTERAIIFHLIWLKIYHGKSSVTIQDLVNSPPLYNTYNITPDYHREWFFIDDTEELDDGYAYLKSERNIDVTSRVMSDLQYLEDNYISFDDDENYSLDLKGVQPLALLMMDGNIRYSYEEEELFQYMMNIFGPVKGVEFEGEVI